jgi:hypothetical protein
MVDPDGPWSSFRPLSQAADIDGVCSITIVDRLARATVWSATFASAQPEAETGSVRIADEVMDTVRGVEQLVAWPGAAESWLEVLLIDVDHFHILRPFGPAADDLIIELVLDARTANLAAARQWFERVLAAYGVAASAATARPAPTEDQAERTDDLPRRLAARPRPERRRGSGAPVDEGMLHKVAAALRILK